MQDSAYLLSINNLLLFNDNIQAFCISSQTKNVTKNLELLDAFAILNEKEKGKMPYRFNLLDDLRTNENDHSFILVRLLQKKSTLEHFIGYLNEKYKNTFLFNHALGKPLVTAEKMRIDALVRDEGKYAIILENKIHYAVEQEAQIGRYIYKCREIGFKEKQIYVLYLTRNGERPSDQTWGGYNKKDFDGRYLTLSYKKDLLEWLKILKNDLPEKEEILRSAVVQYVDFLENMLNINNQQDMNKQSESFLNGHLANIYNYAENLTLLKGKIAEIEDLKKQLYDLSQIHIKKLFEEWKKKMDGDEQIKSYNPFLRFSEKFYTAGITMQHKGVSFEVIVEYNFNSVYYGIYQSNKGVDAELKQTLKPIIDTIIKRQEDKWYGWEYTSFDDGYMRFKSLVDELETFFRKLK